MQQIYPVLLAATLLQTTALAAAPTSGGDAPVTAAKASPKATAKAKHKIAAKLPDPAEATIGGVILTNTGEPLPGATIFIKGTFIGTSTDQLGKFSLNASFENGPVEILVAYVGFETQLVKVAQPDNLLNVVMAPSATLLNETVVSASRVEENILRAPVTIDKVSGRQIERISTPEVLAGLGQLPGVDVNSASMLFTSVSTRGFNTAKSERVIQLVDYMDTALPSLNLSPGNLVGIPELDMESIELIHGPASALYGANALSGVVLFNSKDPFVYDGLSVRLRGGQRELLDGQLRYAKKLGEKWAIKLNASAFQANDWIANNRDAASFSSNPAGSPLGYDAVSSYGEISNLFSPFQNRPATPTTPEYKVNPELYGKTVHMPGFTEQELIGPDQKTRSYRVQGAVSYLIKDDLKLTVEAKRGVGTSTYQNQSRFRIKDLGTNQYRAELKSSKGFIRAYSTEDFTGNSYELTQLSALIQNSPTTEGGSTRYNQLYFYTFNQAYTQAREVNKLSIVEAQLAAKAAADATQLKGSDPRFAELRSKIIADDQPGRGAQQNFNSFLNDISAQRSFHLSDAGTDLILGGAYREYRLGSGGKLFSDTDGSRIRNYEYGAYGQLTQTLLQDHLKLALAGRVDMFQNFDPSFSPRASAVYSFGKDKQHNFRASYGQAFRSPSQTDQYLRSDVRTFILLGNLNGFEGYNFTNAEGKSYTPGASLAGYELSLHKLKLERVNTVEVGYKGAIVPNVYVDASYFRSRYNDFIGGTAFVGLVDGTRPTKEQVNAGLASNFTNPAASPARIIFAAHNNSQEVRTQGATVGITYYLHKALNIGGNYSLNVLDRSNLPANFRTYFNTPKHKYNLNVGGTVLRNLSYSLNYRWVEGHNQELPFANGYVRTYRSTDAYLGYTVPKLATTLQAGVSNLFDTNNTQIIGGPQLGRLAYLGVLVNVK
ncbi:TonB-dependent receptor [Hymenobacter sp. BT635]|uniref:TonB-dependent receptor n=1 Tax=Hymenobacter nitidus TaxID=2880929 RepID=A0ABS8AEX9_9BACT|nr:TonB-dependent receptor [Hymenobacter nitidus]MCB2378973.1 TonB-dependent receptor [Hymenobacter nitidus]